MDQPLPTYPEEAKPPLEILAGDAILIGNADSPPPPHQLWATLESAYPAAISAIPARYPGRRRGFVWLPFTLALSMSLWSVIIWLWLR